MRNTTLKTYFFLLKKKKKRQLKPTVSKESFQRAIQSSCYNKMVSVWFRGSVFCHIVWYSTFKYAVLCSHGCNCLARKEREEKETVMEMETGTT